MGLIEATPNPSCQLFSNATNHEHNNINIQITSLIEKYSSQLAKVSGAKEIYEELIVAVPSRENEFRRLSLEQEKKHIKINEKINTLIRIANESEQMIEDKIRKREGETEFHPLHLCTGVPR
ncbi:hypothetical protein WM532_004753 [Escherichia coli]